MFITLNGLAPTSFQKLFDSYLSDQSLLIDPISGDKRSFYSLRHTYATFRLTHEGTAIHTLAKHMGTSVQMIEKHYSHLQVKAAKEQLRGEKVESILKKLVFNREAILEWSFAVFNIDGHTNICSS